MPNLPTSLLIVLLAVLWIWILVPMASKSREAVPESDDGAAGFRVLRRASLRRRRSRGAVDSEGGGDAGFIDDDADDSLVENLVDEEEDDYSDLDAEDADLDGSNLGRTSRPLVRVGSRRRASQADEKRPLRVDAGRTDAGLIDTGVIDTGHAGPTDAAQEWESEHRAPRPRERSRELVPAPRPHRAGRGGFDPEQAAATAAYKYRRRRLITLTLVGLALAAGAVGYLVDTRGYVVAGVLTLTTVAFLGYLSRTVRIERSIEARRLARLARARELRPQLGREVEPVSPYRGPAERPLARPATGAQAGPGRPSRSHVPPSMRQQYAIVDLDDDDPAFDDLERYQPVAYRRASGQ